MTDWITDRILEELDSEKSTNQLTKTMPLDVTPKAVYYRLKKLQEAGRIEKINEGRKTKWSKV